MEMVKYWKTSDTAPAKVMVNKNGEMVMQIQGEKYPSPGFPRSHLLFGPLSKLKHEIKNQLFNESWWALEGGVDKKQVIVDFKRKLLEIYKITDKMELDLLPPGSLFLSVRELWRAMTVLQQKHPENKYIEPLKRTLTLILQEDDSYRFRLQWIIQIFNPSAWWFRFVNPVKWFEKALCELENGEVVSDMQERIRLLRRILLLILEDKNINQLFLELCREVNWNKLKMSKADKYFFRAKYFFVDLDKFEK